MTKKSVKLAIARKSSTTKSKAFFSTAACSANRMRSSRPVSPVTPSPTDVACASRGNNFSFNFWLKLVLVKLVLFNIVRDRLGHVLSQLFVIAGARSGANRGGRNVQNRGVSKKSVPLAIAIYQCRNI